jgi:tripartite motif-containing protein 71
MSIGIGELPDPNADAIMSRCNVCSEKAYVNPCAHCDKKICDTCKDAHCDILKREISRINNQIKRGIHRIEDSLSQEQALMIPY